MRNVRLNRQDERRLVTTIEKLDPDPVPTPQHSRRQPMHAVDNPHRRPLHKNRRELDIRLGQYPDMFLVLPTQPRRIGRSQ
jgi:hypothetical protein